MDRSGAFILRYAEPCELVTTQDDARCQTQTQTRVRSETADSDASHTIPRTRSFGSSDSTETFTEVKGEGRDPHTEKRLRAIPVSPSVETNTVTEVKAEQCDVDAIPNNLAAIPRTTASGKNETITAVQGEGRDVHLLRRQFAVLPTGGEVTRCS